MPNYTFPTDAKRKVIRIDLASVSYEVGYEGAVDVSYDATSLSTFFSLVDGEITIVDDSIDYVVYPSGVNINIDGSVYPDSWIGSMSLNLTGTQKFFVVKTSSSLVFHSVSQFLSDFGTVLPPVVLEPLNSLNGNGAEFLDGETVNVVSSKNNSIITRDVVYSVVRSYYSLYSDNAYIVIYDLESIEGYKLSCPETLLVRYVEPVIAP